MSAEHSVIIIPGLRDNTRMIQKGIESATNHWRNHGLEPIVHTVGWHDGESFDEKLKKILGRVDEEIDKGKKVSLVGASAGGSAVLNAFEARKDVVDGAVSVAGRLRDGGRLWRSFDARTRNSPAFKQAVERFQSLEPELTNEDRHKIMTVRGIYDWLVPDLASQVDGAYNVVSLHPVFKYPIVGHGAVILNALARNFEPVLDFLKNGSPDK